MEQEYLPGDTPQQRLQDLMKEYKITQAELASKIGVAESSISRFLNGTKNKLTIEQIIRIARIFNVSSDFPPLSDPMCQIRKIMTSLSLAFLPKQHAISIRGV